MIQKKKNDIEILIDRVDVNEENKLRIIESLNACSDISDGIIYINETNDKKEYIYSTKHACPYCGYSVGKLEPKLFSFNSPTGACQRCDGLGVDEFFDENKIVENPELSLSNGAIAGWDTKNHLYHSMLLSLTKHFKIDIDEKFYKLTKKFKDILFYGSDDIIEFDITKLNRRTKEFVQLKKKAHGKEYVIFSSEIIIMRLDSVLRGIMKNFLQKAFVGNAMERD